jgi:Xaa-Pro aminopeptidase
MIKPGITTDWALAKVLRIKLIERGSDISFPPIILSGPDSAFIHGNPFKLRKERERNEIVPAEKVIQKGDIVQFDVGCLVDGYASDISRVVVVGKATEKQKMMHEAICEAIKEVSLRYYRPGVRGDEAQREADRILKAYGFNTGLVHGLGHGIGLEVHEFPVTNENYIFQAGNLLSCEPGIYIKGYGGMRIERDVLITENGPEFLDELTTDLIEL